MLHLTYTELLGVLAFVLAGLVVYVLTPFMASFAHHVGVVDDPVEERRMHLTATPLLGGLVLYLAVVVSVILLLPFNGSVRALISGGTAIALVGLVDDLKEIRPSLKFAGQLAATGLALLFNVRMETLSLPFLEGSIHLPLWASIIVTLLWFVAIINMVNFIDGLDGLAAGVCAISSITFGIIAFSLGRKYSSNASASFLMSFVPMIPSNPFTSLASFCKMILSTATVWLQSGVANRRLGARVNLPGTC